MRLSLSVTLVAAALVSARNDWSTPCFHGECNYDLYHPSGGVATLQFSGAPHAIADITPAAGWVILDCDANALDQDIRLVCANDDNEAESCAHLFSNGGPVNKILRLPDSCGKGPFVRISKAALDSDQSIPAHHVSKIRRRDGVTPDVHVLSVDTAWDKLDTSLNGDVEYTIIGSTIPGSWMNTQQALAERGVTDWITKVISKMKTTAGKLVEGLVNSTTIESGNKTEIHTNYNNETDIVDLSAECAGKKAGLKVTTYIKVDVTGHVGFAAKGSLTKGVNEFGSLIGWHGHINGGVKISAQVKAPMKHEQTLVRYGVPPFDWPGVISFGPRFEVRAHIDGSLDIIGTADIGLNYNIKKAEHVWPGMKAVDNEGQEGDIQPEDAKVNLTAAGDIDGKLNITAGLIPAVVIGLEGFAGQVKAAVAFEVEPYLRIESFGKIGGGVSKEVHHTPSKGKRGQDITLPFGIKPTGGASGSFKIASGVELRGVAVGKLYSLIPGARKTRKWWGKEWVIKDTGVGAIGSHKRTRAIDSGSRPGSASSTKSSGSKSLSRQGSTTSTGSQKSPADDVHVSNATEKAKTSWTNTQWKCPPAAEKLYEMIFVGNGKAPKWEFGHIYKEDVGIH